MKEVAPIKNYRTTIHFKAFVAVLCIIPKKARKRLQF